MSERRAWLVLLKAGSGYGDEQGRRYEFPARLPYAKQVGAGDVFVPAEKVGRSRWQIVGVATVGDVSPVRDDRRRATFDRFLALDPPVTFEELGGDPRRNPQNSFNPIAPGVLGSLLARAGIATVDELPEIRNAEDVGVVTAVGVRDRLQQALERDLLGPADGHHEEVFDARVSDRYLVGGLAPKNTPLQPEEFEDEIAGAGDESSDAEGRVEPETPPSRSLFPSSIGFTFSVDRGTDRIVVEASWGRYERVESESRKTESGEPKRVWRRVPCGGVGELELTEGTVRPLVLDSGHARVVIRGVARRRQGDHDWIVTLFLVNEQSIERTTPDTAWIFQPRLIVRGVDQSAPFTRRKPLEAAIADANPEALERAMLTMSYRRHVEFAVGHGVAVHAELAAGAYDRSVNIESRLLPWYDVPATQPPGNEELAAEFSSFSGFVLDMRQLADADDEQLVEYLGRIPDLYEQWTKRERDRLASDPDLESFRPVGLTALARCEEVIRRLREGVAALANDTDAGDAFRFANRAMWLQRVHSLYALRRRRGHHIELDDVDVTENRSWYPFQLAFILLTLSSVTDIEHADRSDPVDAVADLLWFPTGGGKTEAYLGVAAYTMGLRRLRGVVGDRDGAAGVAVIMRYTLRLLTLQQFQRASTLLCALEVIRREALDKADERWGQEPFRIGLWVGNRATPGKLDEAAEWIKARKGVQWDGGGTSSPLQLTHCPWCGSRLTPNSLKVLPFDGDRGRVLLHCSDKYGRCPFTARQSPEEGIPVTVVDDEIYRTVPTMLLATVDKFAQMPWRGAVQSLFGRVTGRCPRHGYLHPESACTGKHQAAKKTGLPSTERQEHPWLRPPDLIIQDELHLISGPLGSMVGLYETAVDTLCTWNVGAKPVRPKVIASTATTRRSAGQVHNLFLRRVQVFPPPGLDIGDNFFARRRPVSAEHPGRRYLGVCAPGKSRPGALIRVYVALLTGAQHLYEELSANAGATPVDPYLSLLGYFNSLRELGGMRRLVEDDVKTRAFRIEKGERPGLTQRNVAIIKELTSRLANDEVPEILDALEVPFPPDASSAPTGERPPIDVLLATNMLSVGVDVQRLGLMVVAGQPKTTAEYIQATSRVGRRDPGLVCAVLNWARPRDLSHYERFEHYHATFYQQVEALSVTPFAARAIDRGLAGVLASLVRLVETRYTKNEEAGTLDRQDPLLDEVAAAIARRSWNVTSEHDVEDDVNNLLQSRLDYWAHEAQQPGRALGYQGKRDGSTVALLKKPGAGDWELFTTLNSLRDVEPAVGMIFRETPADSLPDWDFSPPPEDDAS